MGDTPPPFAISAVTPDDLEDTGATQVVQHQRFAGVRDSDYADGMLYCTFKSYANAIHITCTDVDSVWDFWTTRSELAAQKMATKMTGAGSPFKSRGNTGNAGDDDDVERAEFPSFTDLVADMTAAFSAGHNLALAMLDEAEGEQSIARLTLVHGWGARDLTFDLDKVISERVTEQLRHDFVAYLYDSYTRSARQRDRLREDSLDSVTLGSALQAARTDGEDGDLIAIAEENSPFGGEGSSSSLDLDAGPLDDSLVVVPVNKAINIVRSVKHDLGVIEKLRKNPKTRAKFGTELGHIHTTTDDMDYVLALLISDNLYTPMFGPNFEDEHGMDEETLRFVKSELIPTRKKESMGNVNTVPMMGTMIATVFAQRLLATVRNDDGEVTDEETPRSVHDISPNVPSKLAPVLARLSDWEFDVFAMKEASDGRPLFFTAMACLERFDVLGNLNMSEVSRGRLTAFLEKVEETYLPNPYHSSTHAADVTQTFFFFITRANHYQMFSDIEILAAICAAAVHDVAHPGNNNSFNAKTLSDKALLYNDQSILEMFHCTTAFEILHTLEFDFLEDMVPSQRERFRQVMIRMILATDIGHHFENIGIFQTRFQNREIDPQSQEDVTSLLEMFLKCADISNPAKPLVIYQRWADLVMREFYRQGDAERALGMEVSAFMDREKPNKLQCQIGFLEYIARPLYQTIAGFDDAFDMVVDRMNENRAHLEGLKTLDAAHINRPWSDLAPPDDGLPGE